MRSSALPVNKPDYAIPGAANGLGRVEPQLRDLIALAGPATALPAWARSLRAHHSGQYLSRVRGRGMEYDESRPYQPGDDIRHLDWRVTARTGKPHTKLFREERERPVFVAVDYNRSMFFATRGVFKAVQAARLASLLAWRAQYNGDRLGGLLFSSRTHYELPPRRGKAAVIRMLKLLAEDAPRCRQAPPAANSANVFGQTITRLQRLAKPGSLVFVLSDFQTFDDRAASEIARLSVHTDVALIAIHDVFEAHFPELDRAAALSDEQDILRLSGVSSQQRARYAQQFTDHLDKLRQLCREQRMLFASVDCASDPLSALMRLFAR